MIDFLKSLNALLDQPLKPGASADKASSPASPPLEARRNEAQGDEVQRHEVPGKQAQAGSGTISVAAAVTAPAEPEGASLIVAS